MSLKNEIGSFCWMSLMTTDVPRANTFYTKLLGWEITGMEIPGHGESKIFTCGERNFGNPVPLGEAPVPSHWISYIAVENVDTSCEHVKKLGGKLCYEAFDLPSVGRTAIVEDPTGAAFHLFTPENKDERVNIIGEKPGQVCWMELMVNEPKEVTGFYGELAQWKFGEPASMNGGQYFGFEACGSQVGGILARPPEAPKMPPAWMPYFLVEDIRKSTQKAQDLGAVIHLDTQTIPETGQFSMIEDPTGAYSYLFQLA